MYQTNPAQPAAANAQRWRRSLIFMNWVLYLSMAPGTHTTPPRRHRAGRSALAFLALALATYSGLQFQTFRQQRQDIVALAHSTGMTGTSLLLTDLEGAWDAEDARMRLARAIVAQALDPDTTAPRDRNLRLAATLGKEVRQQRPANWQAPMIEGAATYLDWSLNRDDRLFRSPESWQQPLLASLELAPSRVEPTRFLASAYLELWPALSPEKRQLARGLLRRAMEEASHFRRLLKPWLSRAATQEEAFSVVPDQPEAWRHLGREYAGRHDWAAFLETRERLWGSLRNQTFSSMEQAEVHLAGKDLRGARHLFLTAAAVAPLANDMDPVVNRALSLSPSGPFSAHYAAGLRRQLDRALELFLLKQNPLEPAVIARLALAAGELAAPHEALAALAAGDLAKAELLERRALAPPGSPEWSGFRIALARALLGRRDTEAAEAALAAVDPSWRQRPIYWQVREALARARSDPKAERLAGERLRLLAGNVFSASDWRQRQRAFRLEWLAESDARQARIDLTSVAPQGTVVEVRLDGNPLGSFRVEAGSSLVFSLFAPAKEIHFLELEALAGTILIPASVTFSDQTLAAAAAPKTTARAAELAGMVRPKSTHSWAETEASAPNAAKAAA